MRFLARVLQDVAPLQFTGGQKQETRVEHVYFTVVVVLMMRDSLFGWLVVTCFGLGSDGSYCCCFSTLCCLEHQEHAFR